MALQKRILFNPLSLLVVCRISKFCCTKHELTEGTIATLHLKVMLFYPVISTILGSPVNCYEKDCHGALHWDPSYEERHHRTKGHSPIVGLKSWSLSGKENLSSCQNINNLIHDLNFIRLHMSADKHQELYLVKFSVDYSRTSVNSSKQCEYSVQYEQVENEW